MTTANRCAAVIAATALISALAAAAIVHITAPSPAERAIAAHLAAHPGVQ